MEYLKSVVVCITSLDVMSNTFQPSFRIAWIVYNLPFLGTLRAAKHTVAIYIG